MLKPFLIVSAVLLAGILPPQAQQTATPAPQSAPPATESKVPAEAVNQANPVRSSAESLARGKKIYSYECAMCHGDDGSGAGDLAKNMKAKMANFRDPSALKGQTDGELFYIIKSGKGEMEGEGGRVKTEDGWNLVNYVRSMSKGQAAVPVSVPAETPAPATAETPAPPPA
jgi:mono/diheme cytochrome c family protein